MKKIVFMTVLFAALINTSCKDTCPAFPSHLKDYYPYKLGDVIKFANAENDILSMAVKEDYASEKYSKSWNCDCACGAEYNFLAELPGNLYLSGRISAVEGTTFIYCMYGEVAYDGDIFTVIKENIDSFTSKNDRIFGDTLTLKDSDATRINNVIIIKGEGVIEFFDIKNNCIWKKVNE